MNGDGFKQTPSEQLLLEQGLRALNTGDVAQAANAAQAVLARNRSSAQGYFLLGLAARTANRVPDAIQAFGMVTQLDSQNADAWANAAELFAVVGEGDKADIALREAIGNEDGNAVVLHTIGKALTELGDHSEASAWYEKALQARPDDAGILSNLAINRMYLGDVEASRARLLRVLALEPQNANAHWLLAGLGKARDDTHIREMRALLGDDTLHPRDEAYLHYACGKEFEDLGHWDDAFAALDAGAAAMRRIVSFDEAAEVAMYRSVVNTYTCDWMDDGAMGFDDPSPVFIVGQPRSGTTLVERILTAHSDVESAGELKQFGRAFRRLAREAVGDTPEDRMRSMDPHALGQAYIDGARRYRGTATLFIDKLPSNFVHLPMILKALPAARVIHMRRGPMDNCFSVYKQLFAGAYPHSYDLRATARHFVRYWQLMDIWRERFAGRFLEFCYEDVAHDPDGEARRLVEALGLEWQDECLKFYEQRAAVSTASVVQVRSPAHTSSIGRWRKYEKQLAPVREEIEAAGIPIEFSSKGTDT